MRDGRCGHAVDVGAENLSGEGGCRGWEGAGSGRGVEWWGGTGGQSRLVDSVWESLPPAYLTPILHSFPNNTS